MIITTTYYNKLFDILKFIIIDQKGVLKLIYSGH
jgi:hypothetical protein